MSSRRYVSASVCVYRLSVNIYLLTVSGRHLRQILYSICLGPTAISVSVCCLSISCLDQIPIETHGCSLLCLLLCLFTFYQSLHFFYGLGALVSPVIAEPFLRSACADGHFQSNIFGWSLENSTLVTYMTYSVDGMEVNMTLLNETISRVSVPRHYHTKSFVQYAYWLVALLQVSGCLSKCMSSVHQDVAVCLSTES